MNVETILISRIGDVGKRLHTGRSRNDQVALDIRMYTKKEIIAMKELVKNLMVTLNDFAYSTPRKLIHRQICVSVHGSLLQNILYTAFYSKIRISLDANPRSYLICPDILCAI